MNKLALAALNIAIEEIGHGEQGKNNAGPDVEKYLNGLAEPPANWCAGFVCWCFYHAYGAPTYLNPPFKYTLSARKLFNQFKYAATIRSDKLTTPNNPQLADLIFFWRGSRDGWMGHVGIVEDVTGPDKFVHTIEGNRGAFPSKVGRYCYEMKNIKKLLGYGRVL
jgi:hypothetical protein